MCKCTFTNVNWEVTKIKLSLVKLQLHGCDAGIESFYNLRNLS